MEASLAPPRTVKSSPPTTTRRPSMRPVPITKFAGRMEASVSPSYFATPARAPVSSNESPTSVGARPPTHAYSTTTSRRPSRRVRAGRRRPFGRRAPAVRPSSSAARSTASASCDGIMAVRRNTMTTETYDWPAIVEGLNRYLRLRSIPIGMKLFETVEAMEAIPKIRRPKARHTTDQIVAQARQLGWTVGITMSDLIGAQCGAVIGLHPQDDEWLSGTRMAGVWFKTREDASAHQHAMDCVPHGRYRAMAVAPLTSGRLNPPDICLIYGTPGQMIFYINGLQWSGYKKMSFTSVGESACADSWGKALKTGEPALTIPCYAERRYGGVADAAMLLAMPPRFLPKVIEGLAALDKTGLRYPIPPYGIQSDDGAGLAVSYADKETSKKA